MHTFQILQSDHFIEMLKSFLKAVFTLEVISGSESMTGIDTYSNPVFIFNFVDNIGQLFKSISQIRPLSGRILKHGTDTLGLIQRDIDRFGNYRQALLLTHFLQRTYRMKIE